MSWKSNTLPELSQAFELLGVDPYYQLAFTTEEERFRLFKEAAKLPRESMHIVIGGLIAGYHEALEASMTDSLTKLPNRAGFVQELANTIKGMKSENTGQAAILFLDLDGFKELNDACGHEMGDQGLIDAAERLRGAVTRETDLVGRLGGDELVMFLTYEVDESVADGRKPRNFSEETIRQKIREALDGLYYPVGADVYPIGASIGVVEFDHRGLLEESSLTEQISLLLKKADQRMYIDKWGPSGRKPDNYDGGEPKRDYVMPPKDIRLSEARTKALANQIELKELANEEYPLLEYRAR